MLRMKYRNRLLPAATLALLLGSLGAAAAESSAAAGARQAQGDTPQPAKKYVACETVTGSRIRPAKNQKCRITASPVRTYTQRDLEMTGALTVADALRRLDPAYR